MRDIASSNLKRVVTDSTIAEEKLRSNKLLLGEELTIIKKLEKKLQKIERQYREYQESLIGTTDEASAIKRRLLFNGQKIRGLNIRCLKKQDLQHVLSYLPESTSSLVSKYWYACLLEVREPSRRNLSEIAHINTNTTNATNAIITNIKDEDKTNEEVVESVDL